MNLRTNHNKFTHNIKQPVPFRKYTKREHFFRLGLPEDLILCRAQGITHFITHIVNHRVVLFWILKKMDDLLKVPIVILVVSP